ncbi:hypothetical protein M405DRAFT_485071 [Rhizopogon salebrosus TDB-379]|nr:hypothetical protein M405DRAFT_485071 [Rhizopogon salebrosus TDB-379]
MRRVHHPLLPVRNSSAPKYLVTSRYEQSPFKMRAQPFNDPSHHCDSRTKRSIFYQYPGYITQLSLCSAECGYEVPLPQNTFHTGHSHIFRTRLHLQKGLQGNLFRTLEVGP